MLCAGIAQDIGFTRKFPKERHIGDYGRLREYFLWRQETSEIGACCERSGLGQCDPDRIRLN